MADKIDISLRDGTLVRHKMIGYEGKIEGNQGLLYQRRDFVGDAHQ